MALARGLVQRRVFVRGQDVHVGTVRLEQRDDLRVVGFGRVVDRPPSIAVHGLARRAALEQDLQQLVVAAQNEKTRRSSGPWRLPGAAGPQSAGCAWCRRTSSGSGLWCPAAPG